ncbi:MAG TPA: TlpA disulfide reductase family protein, partial [Rhodoferax sp.]
MNALATVVGAFALPQWIALLVCAVVAAVIGHFVGRAQKASISATLVSMALAAGLAARLAFVAVWFEKYRDTPWSIFDIRDGGFAPWAGVVAAIVVAIWQGWRRTPLRGPLLMGLLAGTMTWFASLAVIRLGEGPTLSDLGEIPFTTLQDKPANLVGLAHGRPLVVNLWATWCPPCRSEMPMLAAAQQQAQGVNFVFANQGEYAETVQKFLATSHLSLGNVLLDPGKKLGQQLSSIGLPTTLFYDASGRLVDT